MLFNTSSKNYSLQCCVLVITLATIISPWPVFSQELELLADTGRMRTPYIDWSRYTSPGMCLAASRNIQHYLTDRIGARELPGIDTAVYTMGRDTLATNTVTIVRTCSDRFAVDQVSKEDLFPLFQVSLQVGDDQKAQAALERWLSLTNDLAEKSHVLRLAMEAYLGAPPPRVKLAIATLQKLDALGFEARVERVIARIALMQHYRRVADLENMGRLADSVIALTEILKQEDLEQGVTVKAILEPYEIKLQQYLADDPSKLEEVYKARLERWEIIQAYLPTQWAEYQHQLASQYYTWFLAPLGTQVPPMTGKYVFNGSGSLSYPRPGKVSILVQVNPRWRDGASHPLYAAIRHLHKKYGSSIEIVLFVKTVGYTRGSLAQTPDEEAESIRSYFLDHQKLPVTLIVDESPVTILSDGRRIIGKVPYEEVFKNMGMIIAGPDGTYQRVYRYLIPDHMIYRMIDRVVQKYSATGSSSLVDSSPNASSHATVCFKMDRR
jgi:hypothetical protein